MRRKDRPLRIGASSLTRRQAALMVLMVLMGNVAAFSAVLAAPTSFTLVALGQNVLSPPREEGNRNQETSGDIIEYGDMRFRYNVQGKLWPNGIVPYMFEKNISRHQQELFIAAFTPITEFANVNFIDCGYSDCKETEGYLFIVEGPENYSFVGMVGGRQLFSVAAWNLGTLRHLLRHVMGLGEKEGEALIEETP